MPHLASEATPVHRNSCWARARTGGALQTPSLATRSEARVHS
jgi:hypothetical protein